MDTWQERWFRKREKNDEAPDGHVFGAVGPLTDLCLPSIAKDAEYPPLSLRPPSTSLSASAVPYHFNSAVFVSPGRAIRTQHFFFSGRWYHSRLDSRQVHLLLFFHHHRQGRPSNVLDAK